MVDDNEEPALTVRIGSQPGASLRIKALGLVRTGKKAGIIDGIVPQFSECCVATSGRGSNRCIVIAPSEDSNELLWHDFYIRGRFQIVDKIWNPTLAHQFFKEFQPS